MMSRVGKQEGIIHDMTDSEREKLQSVLLSMLLDIKDACEKIGVEFTLIGGSALGAVRHKGFIPWDDDIDIAIFRSEWDKFKANFDKYLGDKYTLDAPNYKNQDTKYPLAKIFLKGTEYVEIEELNYPYNNCIFIDAFVIDNVSDCGLVRNIDAFLSNFMRVVATSMNDYKYPNKHMRQAANSTLSTRLYYDVRLLLGFAFSWVSHKKWCSMFDRFISRHPDTTRLTTVATGHKLYKGEIILREVWLPFGKGEFCGHVFNIPNKAHDYLVAIYGEDYMQLPPPEKRELHPVVRVSFG